MQIYRRYEHLSWYPEIPPAQNGAQSARLNKFRMHFCPQPELRDFCTFGKSFTFSEGAFLILVWGRIGLLIKNRLRQFNGTIELRFDKTTIQWYH